MIKLLLILMVVLVAAYFVLPDRFFAPGRGRARHILDQFILQNGGACADTESESEELISRIGSRLSARAGDRLTDVDFSVVRSSVPSARRHRCASCLRDGGADRTAGQAREPVGADCRA